MHQLRKSCFPTVKQGIPLKSSLLFLILSVTVSSQQKNTGFFGKRTP